MKNHAGIDSDFFHLIENEHEYLQLVVKCHYSIDKMLDKALSESLPQASSIELKRISLLLKVDFLTAIGGLRPTTRNLFELGNTIRNTFAHDPYSELDEKYTNKAKALLCSHRPILVPESFKLEDDPKSVLKVLFSVCFLQASVAYEDSCRQKVSNLVANELVQEALGKKKRVPRGSISIDDDFKARCARMLSELYPGVNPL